MKTKETMNEIIRFIEIIETFMSVSMIDFWDSHTYLYEECTNMLAEAYDEIDADLSTPTALMGVLKKLKQTHVKASGEHSHWLNACKQ